MRRYAEAAQLREDLERQLANRPLAYTREPSAAGTDCASGGGGTRG